MARTTVPLGRPGAVTRVKQERDGRRHALPALQDVGKNQPAEAEKGTPPATAEVARHVRVSKGGGYARSRFNAVRHAVLSSFTVLPWESVDGYRALLDSLLAEHHPVGPTEQHLVQEIAGIFWRRRRLRLAEIAMYHQGMAERLGGVASAKLAAEEPEERLASFHLLCGQAIAEALDRDRLAKFGRYESHLTRQLERTLGTLLRLQDLRRSVEPA